MSNDDEARSLLSAVITRLDAPAGSVSSDGAEPTQWRSLWEAVAARLLEDLESGNVGEFEAGFRVVRDAVNACTPIARQAGMAALFGHFTRRAIAAGIDRTRFVEWFGPAEILNAPPGRIRGRVLYFKHAKGHGRVLGSDKVVYIVHFSAIQAAGFRSLDDGQLVEFTPLYGTFNSGPGFGARELVVVDERG